MKKIIFNKQQDLISIIVPVSSCPDEQDTLKEAIKMLALHGFKTLVDDKIFQVMNYLFSLLLKRKG